MFSLTLLFYVLMLMVVMKNDLIYTLVRNKAFINTTSLGTSDSLREAAQYTIDIIPGFAGSYPDFYLQVDYDDLNNFIKQI